MVLEFEQDKEDLLVLLPMEIQKIRNKDVIVPPRPGSGNGCAISPSVGFGAGKGVGAGGGTTSTHANVISFRMLKKFSARSGPPSSAPVPQGGL